LVLGGGLMLMAFTIFNFVFFLMIAVVIAPLTLAFVFYKPRGITLAQYLSNFVDFLTSEHLYIWRREPAIIMYKLVQKRHTGNEAPMKTVSRSRIRDLANLLDTSASVDMPYESETRPDENVFGR
jgi:hypothetical protein